MYTATYSPEDNKLRLYASERLDDETFQRVKDAGFRWAPKQELFVAPAWSCAREDLLRDLAGDIYPEETTLAERAQMKADRLDGIAQRRAQEATAYQRAAQDIAQRFAGGQPILVGHHSERKARKDHERADSAQRKAIAAHDAVSYWLYRAESVERHANYKNDPRTRARRIKTLLADLRKLQRDLNDAAKALATWEKFTTPELIRKFLGYSELSLAPYNLWAAVDKGETTPAEAREICMNRARSILNSRTRARTIEHVLNRLDYEREMLGPVERFAGDITPTLLQMFVREHGADKPKGEKVAPDVYRITTRAPLPAHIGAGCSLELSGDAWRDLMQSCGYEPPAKKPAKPPILNFKAPSGLISVINPHRREAEDLRQIEVTKAEYAAIGSDYRGTRLASCGNFRVRVCPDPHHTGPRYSAAWVVPLITDQKQHDAPPSFWDMEQGRGEDVA